MAKVLSAFTYLLLLSATSRAKVMAPQILINEKTYQKLEGRTREDYIKEVRRIISKFEEELNGSMKYSYSPLSFFISSAVAGQGGKCLIGGVEQPMNGELCSTRNNTCSDDKVGSSDTFKCGTIFSSACILRTPVNTISLRCRQRSDELPVPSVESFKSIKATFDTVYENHCTNSDAGPKSAACTALRARMAVLSKAVGEQPAIVAANKVEPEPVALPSAQKLPTTQNLVAALPQAPAVKVDPLLPDPNCIDVTQSDNCVPGSLTVGPIIIKGQKSDQTSLGLRGCTKDAKGTPQLTSTIAEEAMLEFIEKHRSNQAVIDGLAAVSSSEAEFLKFLKIQLDSANKKNSEPLFQAPILRPTDDKAKDLERFAQVYNQANNKCEAIKKIAQERKSGVKKSCAADQAKYREIMEDRQRCNPKMESSSACELSFYQALAELASCQEYNISQIGVTETTRAKGLSFEKPCAISLKGASAAIGAGTIEVQANGEIKTIEWSAGYDLGCNSNDLNFWRAQLGPKFAEAFSVADKSSHPKGVSGAGTQR